MFVDNDEEIDGECVADVANHAYDAKAAEGSGEWTFKPGFCLVFGGSENTPKNK